jgi:hypothetical protein
MLQLFPDNLDIPRLFFAFRASTHFRSMFGTTSGQSTRQTNNEILEISSYQILVCLRRDDWSVERRATT